MIQARIPRLVSGAFLVALASCAAPPAPEPAAPASLPAAAGCTPAPLGATTLYLRGSLNAWGALDEYAFQYRCDGYYLNVDAHGGHDFKIADAAWSDASTFGAAAGTTALLQSGVAQRPARDSDPGGTGNLRFAFAGVHTVKLAFVDGAPALSVGPKSFDDPKARPVTDPVALSVRFDSRDPAHKKPFGAVVLKAPIELSLTALPGIESATLVVESQRLEGNQEILEYTNFLRVPMERSQDGERERWTARYEVETTYGVYGYWFELTIGGERYAFQNNRDLVFWTRERGSSGAGLIDFLPQDASTIRRYRQTVYSAQFSVPGWAPDIVYYYIFPDRFRNGDPSNDPKPGERRFHDGTVEFHTDWNEKPYLSGTGDGSDDRYANDFFGGDLAGIIEQLDYIQDLGANTLYMTPIFAAASNHKYDTADYLKVDPGFGTDADFRKLTEQAARRNMRVILDTSLNHTGVDSVYFDRYGNHPGVGAFEGGEIHPESPWASWYKLNPENPAQPWTGWSGSRDLPELDKLSKGFIHFAYATPQSMMQYWLDQGAAGWRMDVAPWVPDSFWREWRYSVKSQRSDALAVAETWFDASKYLVGDMFDSTMNYIFRNTVLEYAAGGDARRLYPNIELMREHYPPPAFSALMNLLSTHDQARSLHVLGDHGDDPAAKAQAKRRMRLAVLWQMTFPGSPAVYYGDEVGVTGGDDPFNRGTYPWPELGGKPDLDMRAEFKRLIGLRNQHAVLRHGSLEAPLYLDEHVIVWLRRLDGKAAIVAINNSEQARSVKLALPQDLRSSAWADALGGPPPKSAADTLTLAVPAQFGVILLQP